jgi:hypothetical protein
MNNLIDETELRRFWDVEKRNGILTEIRLISTDGKIASGYFKNVDNIIAGLQAFPNYGVYYTINSIKDDCYGRLQCEKFIVKPKQTTTDGDILGRDMVVLDIDPVRCAGVNATEEELGLAKAKANEIYKFLRDNGFYSPIVNISANGVHIKLRCAMKNTEENTLIVKNFLLAMDMMFSDEKVSVDTSLSNAARILKACGSASNKGNDNPNSDRPRRMAYYVRIPDDWYENINSNEYFQKVANMLPQKEQPSYSNNYRTEAFDVEAFINKHGIKVARKVVTDRMTKWVLEECPFDSNHKAPDSAIFKMADGSLGFCCLHNSHRHLTFKDLRIKYEPDAYTRKEIAEYNQRQRYYGSFERTPFKPLPETEELGKKWLAASEIKRVEIDELAYVSIGYPEIDKAMWGLFMGDVTVLTGTSGSGKSSLLACIVNNLIERNVKVAMYSGELQGFRLMSWQYCSLAGKTYTKKKEGYDNWYYAPKNVCDRIDDWLKRKLLVYNNNYGNNFFQLFSDIKDVVEHERVSVVVVDNMSALDLSEYQGKDLEKQTKFITDIKNYAKTKNIHVILVVHPRKQSGDGELNQKESVAGSNNLTNLVDNVLIVSRRGIDFLKRLGNFLGQERAKEYEQYDTIVQLCKCRMSGQQDRFFGLFYEPESRRIKNSRAEHIVYGWCAEPVQQQMDFASTPQLISIPEDSPIVDMPFAPASEGEVAPF